MFQGIIYFFVISMSASTCVTIGPIVSYKNISLFIQPISHKKFKSLRNNNICSMKTKIVGLAREEFPLLNKEDPKLKDLIYFNNATTTHKPKCVLDTVYEYYTTNNFSVNRGSGTSHDLVSTQMFEDAREKVANFINASSPSEIIFTSGVTGSINFVSNTWGQAKLKKDDVVLLPISEHNSDVVPWWILSGRVGCKIEYVNLLKNGLLDLDHLENLLKTTKAKILCVAHASNVLGVIQDLKKISKMAHDNGCLVLGDAAQTVGKIKIDVKDLDVDFLTGSGHKMYGPTGIGFLYYKKHVLEDVDPQISGGGAVKDVTFESCDYFEAPYKFEPGTPPVAQAIGLGAAIDFINKIGIDKIQLHDRELLNYLYDKIKDLVDLYNFDIKLDRLPIIPFNVEGVDPSDLCTLLSTKNVLTRSGKHCAYLLHKVYFCKNTMRVSLAMYNSSDEVDKFIDILKECLSVLKK